MGRRKTKAQNKLLSGEEDAPESSLSLGPDVEDREEAVSTASGDDQPTTTTAIEEVEPTPQISKKKEYKGNKLKKMQEGKQKNAKSAKHAAGGGTPAHEASQPNSDGNESDGADSAAAAAATHKAPVEVLYCPFCTFPAEMCEFGGMMDKCRPWLLEHAPEFADAENLGRKRRILTERERIEAMIAGKGVKKAIERHVVLEVGIRTGKRKITSITGMDLFGFNLKDLSKEWRKTFSCGVGVRDAAEGAYQDCIDIQGDVMDKLVDILLKKFEIPKEAFYHIVNKKKVKYFDHTVAS